MMPERKVRMDLEIKYERGSMVIHLEEFMNCHGTSKVRKLVKIIRSSYTPECEDKIRGYAEQEIEQFESRQVENARYIIGYKQKVTFAEQQVNHTKQEIERVTRDLKYYQALRDSHRKNTKVWKSCNEELKKQRERLKEPKDRLKEQKAELQHFKNLLRSRQSNFDRNVRNKEFYKKVLQIIT